MTPLQDEILTILVEECAEVIQECCKVKRFGLTTENRDKLERELGQLQTMVSLYQGHVSDIQTGANMAAAFGEKLIKMKTFTTHIKDVI